MRGHKIRHKVLLLTHTFGDIVELLLEPLIYFYVRLSHIVEHLVACVFGSDFKLTADMVCDKFFHKLVVTVLDKVIVANAGAHENFLNVLYLPHFPEYRKILGVIHFHIRTGRRSKTFLPLAESAFYLLFAGRETEIRSRSSHVMNISLEVRHCRKLSRFVQHRLLASRLNASALMQRNGAEVTEAETAAVVGDRELDFLYRRHSSLFLVHRVICPHIRELVGAVKLGLGKASLWRVLYQHHISVALNYRPSVNLVLLVVLLTAGFCIGFLVVADKLEAVTLDSAYRGIYRLGEPACSADIVHIPEPVPCFETVPYLGNGKFAHSVHQQFRSA